MAGYSNKESIRKEVIKKLFSGDTLDSIYERFNLQHPADFRGHSLSVSDVIVMHQNGQDQAYYVDSFGFKKRFRETHPELMIYDAAVKELRAHYGK